jgi:hypothetical protein
MGLAPGPKIKKWGCSPEILDFGLGGPVEVQKGYIPSCLLNDELSIKLFGDAVWIGRAGGKKKCNICILCDAVVFGNEN